MKNFFKWWTESSLILKIVCGIILGAIAALLIPNAQWIGTLGSLFVGALKAIAPVLVFVLVISALANANTGVGKQFSTVIGLYILNTFVAAVLAVVMTRIFPLTVTLQSAVEQDAPQKVGDVFSTLLNNCVANPIASIAEGNYLGILVWAVIFGLALKFIAADTTKNMLKDFADAITKGVRWVIQFAPIGIFGLVYTAVTENGMEIFTEYGKLIALLVGCMAAMAFVVIPLIVFVVLRENPYPLCMKCLKESGITAFFTRSSAANIPVNMTLCDKLGLDKDLYSVSIPLGATINMNGAAITITVLALTAANTLGVPVTFASAVILSVLATASACGASGVPGGSLLLIPLACSLFGISNDIAMQMVGVGFIIGVIQDSCETAINSSGDVIFAATAEFYHRKKAERNAKKNA